MKVAVTYQAGMVFQHFGKTEEFKIYTIEDGELKDSKVVSAGGASHGALAGFLCQQEVDILICGGLGGGARDALEQCGIKVYPGVSGEADKAANALFAGTLKYNPDASCNHHGEDHGCHGGDHSCHE